LTTPPPPAPRKALAAPPAAPVYREAHVLKLDFDEGISAKNNKPWQRWRVTFDDQTPMATTFSKTLGDAAREAHELGALVQYSTEVTPKGVNLVSIEPALF
jgi:hypothetical protein